jgi:hypothetical protein
MPEPEGTEKPSLKQKILESLTDPKQYAVLDGEFRRGLKDLQDAVIVAFPDSMKSRDEPGTIANPQMIVTEEIKGKEGKEDRKFTPDDFRAIAKENKQEQEKTQEKTTEKTKEQEIER